MVKKREFLGRWRKDKTGLLVWKWKKRKPTKYVAPLIGEYEVGHTRTENGTELAADTSKPWWWK